MQATPLTYYSPLYIHDAINISSVYLTVNLVPPLHYLSFNLSWTMEPEVIVYLVKCVFEEINDCVKIVAFVNILGCSPIHVQYSTNCIQCNLLSLGTNITKVLYIHYSLSLVLIGDFKISVAVSVLHFVVCLLVMLVVNF